MQKILRLNIKENINNVNENKIMIGQPGKKRNNQHARDDIRVNSIHERLAYTKSH